MYQMKNGMLRIVTLMAALTCGVANAAAISVDMVPGGTINNSLSLTEGTSFDVDILIDDATDLAGFEFDLNFDSAVLSANSVTSGDIFGLDTFLIDDTISAGSVSFSEMTFALSGLDVTTPTVLATISFDTLAAGTSLLNLTDVVLSDSLAYSILPVTNSGGVLTVTGGGSNSVPEPATLFLLFGGLIGIVGLGRKKV
ncbi:MAG: hypothetical protein CSB48_07085 [Proteobacteria bacterium]|nr:MAG: hypothetical protein CSB48_07085 [Pseudomonadota bacterium]PIE40215.1 MAG: hypothetical protein CSA51_01895 [Gammaproteobacteria bacterium]